MAEALAKRTGRTPDELAVRVAVGAVIGVIMAIMRPETLAEGAIDEQAFSQIDEALSLLEAGLPL